MSPKKAAILFPMLSASLILLLNVCHAPPPLLLEGAESICTWNQGGGSPARNAFYDTEVSGYPTPVWRQSLTTPVIVAPTASMGYIFAPTTNNRLSIVSLKDGSVLRKLDFKGPIPAPVGVDDSFMVVNEDGHRMVVDNWVDNQRIWEVQLKGTDFEPLIFNKRVYWQDGSGLFHCYEISEGRAVWEKKLDYSLNCPGAASDSFLVLAGSGPTVECLSTENGRSFWRVDMEARVRNSLEIVDDTILYCTSDGHLGELSMEDGSRIWDIDLGAVLIAPPASDGEGIFLGTNEGRFMRIGFSSGQIEWQHEIDAPIKGGAAIFGDMVVYVSLNHKAYFVDKYDGTTKSEFETKGMLSTQPIACSDRIFIAGEDKYIYCFQVTAE